MSILIFAPLAQLVEQLTLNQMVGGSNPLWRTKKQKSSKARLLFFYIITRGFEKEWSMRSVDRSHTSKKTKTVPLDCFYDAAFGDILYGAPRQSKPYRCFSFFEKSYAFAYTFFENINQV